MPKPLCFDLRSRVLAAVDAGLSCRQAAARFGGSASSAIRWQASRRSGGDARPKPQGGDRLSRKTEAHADLIRAALDDVPDLTLPELKARLAGQGRSEEHTSELQSRQYLVCRLLLEKKKKNSSYISMTITH